MTSSLATIVILGATFFVALRSVFVLTPWQPYLICALAAFLGEMLEGFVIDSDHWRYFFLLLGMIWELGAATVRYWRQLYATVPTGGRSYVGAT